MGDNTYNLKQKYISIQWFKKANCKKHYKINKKCTEEDGREEMKKISFIIALMRELMSATMFK